MHGVISSGKVYGIVVSEVARVKGRASSRVIQKCFPVFLN